MRIGKLLLCAAALAAGCATLSDRAKSVRETNADAVAACHFIRRIDAGYVPRSAASKLEVLEQKKDALEKAAAVGATDVVWDQRDVANRTLITAGAYRCDGAPPTAAAGAPPTAAPPATAP
jgi:hypothetical protein